MTGEYQAFFESAPDGILVVDEGGVICDANPMAGTLFGYERHDLLGKLVEVLVPERTAAAHVRQRRGYMDAPRARPMGVGMELRGRRRDGSEFPVEISLSPWRTTSGLFVIAAVRDVTEHVRLRDFGAGALRASENERRRIAHELHDDTAQRLATLMLRIRLLQRGLDDDDLVAELEELRDKVADVAEGIRRTARGLRPPELEDAGLSAALQAHARSIREGTAIDIRLDVDPVDGLLSDDARLTLYRVVQEAVSNAVRHADTERVEVRVTRNDRAVVATVVDRGRGFVLGEEEREGGGLGLLNMRERALMVRGRVKVESAPGAGTKVTLEIPVADDEP